MHSRISDTYLLLLLPFDTRGKKRAGISRIVRTHNRLVVATNRSFVVSQLGIYFKIRVLDREEEGWEWEKQREGKLPGAN